jgi:anti-sigma B factor antagonist
MTLADVRFIERDGVGVAHLSGEIDISNAGELGSAVIDATPSRVIGVVIDLADVTYMDSAGVHLVYRLREILRARGQELQAVIPEQSPVDDALRLAGVKQHVNVAETVEEALLVFRGREGEES